MQGKYIEAQFCGIEENEAVCGEAKAIGLCCDE